MARLHGHHQPLRLLLLLPPLLLLLLFLLLLVDPTRGFACDRDDLVQLDYFPGLNKSTHFSKTRESNSGREHCITDFYQACLTWCAYDENCVSVHFMLRDTWCLCHKCYIMLDQLQSPQRILYGRPCSALTHHAEACVAYTCKERQRNRMITQFGSPYEEVPMLHARVWMSSVENDSFPDRGPQLAVDDSLLTFAQHQSENIYRDGAFHWMIVELPFHARVTHVTVKPSGADFRRFTKFGYDVSSNVSGVYLLNWDIMSVAAATDCLVWASQDRGTVGAYFVVLGQYVNKDYMCVFGQNTDPWAWRSAIGSSKLQVTIRDEKCQLTVDQKPWKQLTKCSALTIWGVPYGQQTANLHGAELLAAHDMPAVPEALFSSRMGIYHKDRETGRERRKYDKLISWKHWTHCGQVSYLLSRTSQGKAIVLMNQNCRSQYSMYLAIRSINPLSIADIQVYRAVSLDTSPPSYKMFACPASQYGGFTPEFVGTFVRPHVLDMTHLTKVYNIIKEFASTAYDATSCSKPPKELKTDIRQNFDGYNKACSMLLGDIQKARRTFLLEIVIAHASFAKPAVSSGSQFYLLRRLVAITEDFIAARGIRFDTLDRITVKKQWTDYLVRLFHPEDILTASLLHDLRHNLYSAEVGRDSKLRSTLYANSMICFTTCHWAQTLVSADSTIPGQDPLVKLLFSWLIEAFCPNPCATNWCKRIRNSENHQCLSSVGLWQRSYKCLCKPGHIWSKSAHDCLSHNPCSYSRSSSLYPCHTTNTMYCQTVVKSNTSAETVECVCREGFAGKQCQSVANPCRHMHRTYKLAGDFACGVPDNFGSCSFNGSTQSAWRCACRMHRARDMTLKYDNCAAHRNSCLAMVCIHGHFLSSPNGALCHCKCHPGYDGPSCGQWSGVWSPWSQWDRCRPECGHHRRSLSLRRCLNRDVLGNASRHDFCVGPWQRWSDCGPTACWLGGDRPLTKSLRLRARYLLLAATVGCLLAALGAAVTVICCRYRGYNVGIRPAFEPVYN